MPVTVENVEDGADHEPDAKPLPCRPRQPQHGVEARERTKQADRPDDGHQERSMTIWFRVPEHQYPDTDDGKRRERSDVGEVVDLVLVSEERAERNDNP